MHEYQRKFRLLAALQARRPLDPTRYPGADGRAYQPGKFVVLLCVSQSDLTAIQR